MGEGVADVAWGAALAVGAGCVVGAAQTAARVGVTEAGRVSRVAVTAAVTWQADTVRVVESITAPVAVGALVLWLALVTHRLPTGVCGGGKSKAGSRTTKFTK